MVHCTSCGNVASHFTLIDDGHMGAYCDGCVNAGVLACIGINTPADPGFIPAPVTARVPFEMPSRG
jgi:hypothetical protein